MDNLNNEGIYEGTLSIHPSGNGFVNCKENMVILIPKNQLNYAITDSIVSVKIIEKNEKGYVGKVISEPIFINKTYVGKVHHFYSNEIFVYIPELGKRMLVSTTYNNVINKNDYVVINIQNIENNKINGIVLEYIGEFSNLCFEKKYNFVENNDYEIDNNCPIIVNRIDLREHNVFTIDPPGSKDLDDAFSVVKKDDGYHIYVHIADTTEYIYPGSNYFDKMVRNGNTYYCMDKNWTMIPRILSDNYCSILPNKDTYTITNEFLVDDINNKLIHLGYYYSIVSSKRQYTYEEIDLMIDNSDDINILLKTSEWIYSQYNFFQLNISNNKSYKIIEYWMIYINNIMGEILIKKGCGQGSFRYHPKPYNNQMRIMKDMIETIDNELDINTIDRDKCCEILKKMYDDDIDKIKTYEYIVLDMMRKATYENYNKPHSHYALGIENYCHFTSPIRRSSDQINHLFLRGYEFTDSELEKYNLLANEAETKQVSIEKWIQIEKNINKMKNNENIYTGLIIKIDKNFIDIYIPNLNNTTTMHISKLSNTHFIFDSEKKELRNNYVTYKFFQKINIRITKIDEMDGSYEVELMDH